jgi:hypothetical protein
MESNVVEVQFLYAPRVGQCSVIVSTEDEQTQMSVEELKQQYPELCEVLSLKFNLELDNNHFDWDLEGDWECGEGTLHPNTQGSCDCTEQNEEYDRWIKEDIEKQEAIKEMLNESWSEEDKLKLQALREKIANQ